jgi:two-component system, NarL family, nitrate/nitrite response regulator NarL
VLRLLVYHRDALFVDAMRAALESEDLEVVGADSIDEVFAASPTADSCLIDARDETGRDALRELSAAPAPLRTFGFVDSGNRQQIMAVVQAGAAGWVTTADGFEHLVHVVQNGEVGKGLDRAAIERTIARALPTPHDPHLLTARETQVLAGLAEGASTKALAARMNVSPATARTHVHSVLAKLGVHTRLEAVAYAVAHRLVEIDRNADD